MRFFPKLKDPVSSSNQSGAKESPNILEAAEEFAHAIPENTFSMAELQGYLLEWKQDPIGALHGIGGWVESECKAQQERAARERMRKETAAATMAQQHYPIIPRTSRGSVPDSGPQSRLDPPPTASSHKPTSVMSSKPITQGSDTYENHNIDLGSSKVANVQVQVSPLDPRNVVSDIAVP